MDLDNIVSKTWNRLTNFRNRLVSSVRKSAYVGAIASTKTFQNYIQKQIACYALTIPFSLRQIRRRTRNAIRNITLEGIVKAGLASTLFSPIPAYAVQSETTANPRDIPQTAKQQVDELTFSYNNPSWVNSQNNLQNELIAQPELGYVIKSETTGSMDTLNNILKSSANVDIKPIKGINREGVSVVYNNNTATENQNTIEALKTYNQVQYAAPLFSSNGETVAIIPEIVARISDGTNYDQLQKLCGGIGLNIKKRMEYTDNEYLIDVLGNDANAVFAGVEQLNQAKFIEWAAPNVAFQPRFCGQFIPNDEYFPRQWHLHNTGQSGGTPNADINAPEAWEITYGGDPNIVIAVLDTGVDYNHPDLFENIWVNPNIVTDINSDGVINIHDLDLNQNGSIDDNELNQYGNDKGIIGWDFYDNDNSPDPLLGHPNNAHGTAVAGIIAAKGNNSIGVAGVAYNCKIMLIRISSVSDNGGDNLVTEADIATAFRWAAENADILNNSWGYLSDTMPIVHSAVVDITTLGKIGRKGKGCVVLASSGNSESFLGFTPIVFPAKYPEVIAVGATDNNDILWSYSSHGLELDLVAPSANLTTDITRGWGYNNNHPNISYYYTDKMGGTSGACPAASGIAALVLSANPELNSLEVRRILSRSAKDLLIPSWDQYTGHGRVDAYAAVKMALNPPEPIIFVDDDAPRKENPDFRGSLEDGSAEHPFDTIQEALNNATQGDTVIISPGIYTGTGNYDLDFLGKAITVRSMDGPESCVIDCQNLGRGFYFKRGEGADSVLEGLTITNGNASLGAGIRFVGRRLIGKDSPTIRKCIFTNNTAERYGGGVSIYNSNPTLTNCTFSGNSSNEGGGIEIQPQINSRKNEEPGIHPIHINSKITNCIFWGNTPQEIYIQVPESYDYELTHEITYNNVQGGWPGPGNINVNPLFADMVNGDYHLKSQAGRWNINIYEWIHDDVTSPCIDAGNPGSPLENELTLPDDLSNVRGVNLRINMGAYGGTAEASMVPYNWALLADLTNDGVVNLEDFAAQVKYWRKTGRKQPGDLNRDDVVNILDLVLLTEDWLKQTAQYKTNR